MNRITKTILVIFLGVAASGCSVFANNTQSLKITCSEPDATLQVNGGQIYIGKTKIEAKRNKLISIACFKPGYFPAHKVISSSLSGTGKADLAGSFLLVLPALGLFTPGAWNLDETDVTLFMVKD